MSPVARPSAKKQVLFLTPTSSIPFAPLPLTPVPPTPSTSPTYSDLSVPSSESSSDSYGPSTPPVPAVDSEYYAPEPARPIHTQLPSIHYILSRPSFDLSLPLAVLLSRIPPEHLKQAATSPPISSLFIRSPLLPWFIHVTPEATPFSPSPSTPSHSAVLPCTPAGYTVQPPYPSYQYSASPPATTSSIFPAEADEYYVPPDAFITVQDIIITLHSSINAPIKIAEYNTFPEPTKDNVGISYHSRIANLDEKSLRKARKKGALRLDVLPARYYRVIGFYVGTWDSEKAESSWGVEFGL